MSSDRTRVWITGIGVITPVGTGVAGFRSGLRAARSTVKRIDRFDPSPFRSQVAAQEIGVPRSAPSHIADALRRLEQLQRIARALVEAADDVFRVSDQVGEAKAQRASDQSVNCKGPCLGLQLRNAQMAEHNHVLRGRHPRLQLMRQERNAAEQARGIHFYNVHARLCAAPGL